MKFTFSFITLVLLHSVAAHPGSCRAGSGKKHYTPQPQQSQAPAVPKDPVVKPAQPAVPVVDTPPQQYTPPETPKPSTPAPETPKPSTPATETPYTPPTTGSSDGLVSGGKAAIDTVNDYRQKAGLPLMTWDAKLAANAYKTGADAKGKALTHQLNSGSYGQVLVFGYDDADKCDKQTGSYTPFDIYFLSWMCERPGDAALGGVCPKIAELGRINSAGQTGHHDLLANAKYKKIGCAFARNPAAKKCDMFPGVWACDLGY